jgi:hypothetical protein
MYDHVRLSRTIYRSVSDLIGPVINLEHLHDRVVLKELLEVG